MHFKLIDYTSEPFPNVCRAAGYETIMMNSNPETVSTDYDTSSRLYFEPLTVEDVLNVLDKERPEGIIVQFGGQTPLSLAGKLQEALKANPIPAASGKSYFSLSNTGIYFDRKKRIQDVNLAVSKQGQDS